MNFLFVEKNDPALGFASASTEPIVTLVKTDSEKWASFAHTHVVNQLFLLDSGGCNFFPFLLAQMSLLKLLLCLSQLSYGLEHHEDGTARKRSPPHSSMMMLLQGKAPTETRFINAMCEELHGQTFHYAQRWT
jgi:hypothetical protein